MHVHVCACTHLHIYLRVTRMRIHTHSNVHIHMHTRVSVYHTQTPMHMHVHAHTCSAWLPSCLARLLVSVGAEQRMGAVLVWRRRQQVRVCLMGVDGVECSAQCTCVRRGVQRARGTCDNGCDNCFDNCRYTHVSVMCACVRVFVCVRTVRVRARAGALTRSQPCTFFLCVMIMMVEVRYTPMYAAFVSTH